MSILIPKGRLLKIRKLASKNCASFSDGNCIPLDCKCCVQQDSETIICKYFMKSVLPLDEGLENEILELNNLKTTFRYRKTCKCGTEFMTNASNQRLCDTCKKSNNKQRHIKYNKKR